MMVAKYFLRFLLRHGDADIQAMMDDSVPPIDLMRVGLFRVAVQQFEKKAGHLL